MKTRLSPNTPPPLTAYPRYSDPPHCRSDPLAAATATCHLKLAAGVGLLTRQRETRTAFTDTEQMLSPLRTSLLTTVLLLRPDVETRNVR